MEKCIGSFVNLDLLIYAKRPVYLRVVGYDDRKPNTVFFDRTYGSAGRVKKTNGRLHGGSHHGGKKNAQRNAAQRFRGKKWFSFPLPIAPDYLRLEISDKNTGKKSGIQILDKRISCKKPVGLSVDAETKRFIEFAAWFARHSGTLRTGLHSSANNEFHIRYLPVITSLETGKRVHTPARVSHETGVMEVSQEDFLQLSVVNRLVILLHEFFHVYGNTTNEKDCDRFALNVALKMGFSKTECFYTLSKLFMYSSHPAVGEAGKFQAASEQEKEERVLRAKDFIMVFQEQHG